MLTRMEHFEQEVADEGVGLLVSRLPAGLNALYVRDKENALVILGSHLSRARKLCACAEELGHHHTSVGNLTHVNQHEYRRQERRAQKWACRRLLPLDVLGETYALCDADPFTMADLLEVPKEFIDKSIELYADIYGAFFSNDKYAFRFIPFFDCRPIHVHQGEEDV